MDDKNISQHFQDTQKLLDEYLNELYHAYHSNNKELTLGVVSKNMLIIGFRSFKNLFTFRGLFTGAVIVAYSKFSFDKLPVSALLIQGAALLALTGVILYQKTLRHMATVGDNMFNLAAFEKLKSKEYKAMLPVFQKTLMPMEKLLKEIKGKEKVLDEKILDGYLSQIKTLEAELSIKENSINELQEALNDTVEDYMMTSELAEKHEGNMLFFTQLLRKLEIALRMIINGNFNLNHLDFGVRYSIYEVKQGVLELVGCSSGVNRMQLKSTIKIKGNEDPVAEAYRKKGKLIIFNNEKVISQFICLDSGEEWVFNLYLEPHTKELLNPEDSEGRIKVDTLLEMVLICLEVFTKMNQNGENKEAVNNG